MLPDGVLTIATAPSNASVMLQKVVRFSYADLLPILQLSRALEFGSGGYTLIYYAAKEHIIILRDELPLNVFMFNGRPNLERTISGIISSIARGAVQQCANAHARGDALKA